MAILRIPATFRPGLVELLNLTDAQEEELAHALSELPPIDSSIELTTVISEQIRTIEEHKILEIIRTLLSLYGLQENVDSDTNSMVSDVINAMNMSGDNSLKLSEDQQGRFRQRIVRLLEIRGAVQGAKLIELTHEYERTFIAARILTDIRPMFSLDPDSPPSEAIIVHSLKLSVHEGQEHKDIYISMTPGDLSFLQDVLRRAQSKERSLARLLDSIQLPHPHAG
jgi:hypothetical protein